MIRVFQGHYSPLNTNIGAFDARSLSSNVSGVNNGANDMARRGRGGWGRNKKRGRAFFLFSDLKIEELICPTVNTFLRIL